MPFDGREGLKFASSPGLSCSTLASCYPGAGHLSLVPMMNPSAYWCCHARSTQFFNLYILFSSPFSSPAPAPLQWVLAFSEHVIFSYSFFKKNFYTTYLQTKHIQRKKHSCCAMERGKCRWEWKSGGRDTHSHTIICLVLFFWFCIDSKARARENGESIAESNRRFSRFSFSFSSLGFAVFLLDLWEMMCFAK